MDAGKEMRTCECVRESEGDGKTEDWAATLTLIASKEEEGLTTAAAAGNAVQLLHLSIFPVQTSFPFSDLITIQITQPKLLQRLGTLLVVGLKV